VEWQGPVNDKLGKAIERNSRVAKQQMVRLTPPRPRLYKHGAVLHAPHILYTKQAWDESGPCHAQSLAAINRVT